MNHLSILVAALGGLSAAVSQLPAQSWTQTSAPSTNWSCVASSADGSKLVAAVNGGLIYTSTNSGATWAATSAPTTNWSGIASSADGAKLVAMCPFALFTSSDFGSDWAVALDSTPQEFGPPFSAVVSSSDGTLLTALTDGLLVSTDSGMAWTWAGPNLPVGIVLNCVACSANGTKVALGEQVLGGPPPAKVIEFLTDTGTNLVSDNFMGRAVPDGFAHWVALASSADGTKVSGLLNYPSPSDCPGQLWYTWDSGLTSMTNCLPARTWAALACSADGTTLAAVGAGDAIYISTNPGATWTPTAVPTGNWSSVTSCADGTKLVAVVDGGGIYTRQFAPMPALNITPSGNDVVISWVVPAMNFVLQQNSDIATINWTDVTAPPVLNLASLQNQVTVPAPAGRMFYRLISR